MLTPLSVVTVNDEPIDVVSWSTDHKRNAIGQATFTIALPLPEVVEDNATLRITVSDGDGLDGLNTVFHGSIRGDSRTIDSSGMWATFKADGWLHLMEFPQDADKVYGGGAGTSPASLVNEAHHLGDNTLVDYEVDVAEDVKYDASWTPAVDSSFVTLTGIIHGSNDYENFDNPKITKYSRVEIRQDGVALGYALFPKVEDDEVDYDVPETYETADLWTPFSITIAAALSASGGSATARFISGYVPNGGGREDFEFKDVRRQTAGKMTARQVIRGLFKQRGFGGVSDLEYVVDEIVDVAGETILLGGNGFVDNGYVRISGGDSFFRFISRLADLFGYATYDSPDGVPRVRAIRGVPSESAFVAATFTEGVNLTKATRLRETKGTYNHVIVKGASGTYSDGTRFQYVSETPSPVSNPNIPDNPGKSSLSLQDQLLVSDLLCEQVRLIQEVDSIDGFTEIQWESRGYSQLQPGRVVVVDAATIGASGRYWLTGIRHSYSEAGFWSSYTGWRGGVDILPDVEDPDSEEDASEPFAPAVETWYPYTPRADF